jgi:hypothetical protein
MRAALTAARKSAVSEADGETNDTAFGSVRRNDKNAPAEPGADPVRGAGC